MCDDGVERPVIDGEFRNADGNWGRVPFLVDSGPDRTVLSADVAKFLGLVPTPESVSLHGVGGASAGYLVTTELRLHSTASEPATIRGTFTVSADPACLDLSILGRDITNHFALIVDRPGNFVCMLVQDHRYTLVKN